MKINFLNSIGFTIMGIIIGILGTILFSNAKFNQNVRNQVFNECFNYYANIDKEHGIGVTTVQTCKDKARDF